MASNVRTIAKTRIAKGRIVEAYNGYCTTTDTNAIALWASKASTKRDRAIVADMAIDFLARVYAGEVQISNGKTIVNLVEALEMLGIEVDRDNITACKIWK